MKKLCTVCDSVYFNQHATKLINSVENLTKTSLIVIVVSPNQNDIALMKKINSSAKNTVCNYIIDSRNTKTFYASARYIYCADIIRKYELEGIMLLDSDSLILKEVEYPDTDFGLFLREPFPNTTGIVKEGSYVLGSSVYIGKSGIEFAEYLRQELNSYVLDTWYLDQVALWKGYQLYKDKLTFTQLDKSYLDWDFDINSTIWNAKGPRKYNDKNYIEKVAKFFNSPF